MPVRTPDNVAMLFAELEAVGQYLRAAENMAMACPTRCPMRASLLATQQAYRRAIGALSMLDLHRREPCATEVPAS